VGTIFAREHKGPVPGSPDSARMTGAALWAFFALGVGFGLASQILATRETAILVAILVFLMLTVVLLRKLAERSDKLLLAGDFSYRGFFDSAIEGIFRTTPDGHYLDVNPALARIYGYESPEALKAAFTDIAAQLYVDPSRRDAFKKIMAEYDEISGFVSEIRRRDGSTIWISENARAIRDWKEQIVCYQGTVEDVTARFAAERAIKKGLKRAEQANRTKNAFLAMMSHELKTPLNAIIGFSEMIAAEMLGPIGNKAYLGYIGDIHASGNKLLAIINDVLDVARLEGNAITLNRCECCAQEIAETALKRARAHTGDNREVVFDVPDSLPTLNVDKHRLAQVLANLLANALKFTPAPGVVILRAWQVEDGSVHFAVTDNGIGMTDEVIAMVLQPFHQADGSLARRFEGAGLGLPIAHALAKLHGGGLAIVSAEGRGTTVTVELPPACLWQEEPETAAVYG
jgi:PAS domain S-box-containing protein